MIYAIKCAFFKLSELCTKKLLKARAFFYAYEDVEFTFSFEIFFLSIYQNLIEIDTVILLL